MVKKTTIQEAYLVLQNASPIKKGDRVKVLRKAEDGECGWGYCWSPDKDRYIGNEYIVEDVAGGEDGFILNGNYFPWFVLEKTKSSEKIEITINGETRNISQESYEQLKDLFSDAE